MAEKVTKKNEIPKPFSSKPITSAPIMKIHVSFLLVPFLENIVGSAKIAKIKRPVKNMSSTVVNY